MSRQQGDQIQPIVFRDMTGGLWERGNEREVPQNGLIECQDCMPLPSGGLRAAWAWRTESLPSGMPKNRRVMGFRVVRGLGRAYNRKDFGLMLGSTEGLTVANRNGPWTYEYWGARQSSLAASTSEVVWTSGRQHTSVGFLWPVKFAEGYNSSGEEKWYYNVFEHLDLSPSQTGLWRLNTLADTTAAAVQVTTFRPTYVASHQERLVLGTRGVGVDASVQDLRFTDPSTDTAPPSSNRLTVGQYHLGQISYFEPFFPDELVVLKLGHAIFRIQGDMAAGPLVRESAITRIPERISWGIRTNRGIIYMTEGDGVWAYNGGEPESISRQFVGTPMTKVTLASDLSPDGATVGNTVTVGFLGVPGQGRQWIVFPLGYIYDLEMNCWFKTTLPGNDLVYPFWSYDHIQGRMYGIGYREPGDDLTMVSAALDESASSDRLPESRMVRSSSFQFTLPLLDMAERSIQVRYIEVFGQGFGNGGTWQLELSNDKGKTDTTPAVAVPARAASARFDATLQGDWLKIRVLSKGNPDASQPVTQASEAPMIDRVVIWARPKTRRT